MVKPKAWMVSQLLGEDMQRRSASFQDYAHASPLFAGFKDAVARTLRGVEFCYIGINVAVVYRPGDAYSLGEIGHRNIKARGNPEMKYYVQSRGIKNDKYKDSNWQHFISASKVMATAVKAAATYLRPMAMEDIVREASDPAYSIVHEAINATRVAMNRAAKELTGNAYMGDLDSDFMKEVRLMTFTSPRLNAALAEFNSAMDKYADAQRAITRDALCVTLTDYFGQLTAITQRVSLGSRYNLKQSEPSLQMAADQLSDFVKGRVAILSMVAPQTYVQDVGLRLDDRIFFIMGEDGAQ